MPLAFTGLGESQKLLIRQARRSVADLIGAHPLEVVFTSGGSESNNMALKGVALKPQNLQEKKQILYAATEHPSVINTVRALGELGYPICEIPVSRDGVVDLAFYKKALSRPTLFATCMYANNETGHIFPISEMAEMAHRQGALFHCDGVQALGKTDVDVKAWGADLVSFSGHKFYALKGVGALYIRKGLSLSNLIHGGSQERKRRAGTENTLGIASFGFVAERCQNLAEKIETIKLRRDQMESLIVSEIEGIELNGSHQPRVCNTSHFTVEGIDGESLLINLDLKGFAVSTGAACSSGNPEPSATLLAMGFARSEAQRSMRVSLGWFTTEKEVLEFVKALKASICRLREVATQSYGVSCG